MICKANLNSRNLFLAINEWVCCSVDYVTGVIEADREWYLKLNKTIRSILTEFQFHAHPAALERLYLKRSDMGRGLSNLVHRSERILAKFGIILIPSLRIRREIYDED